MATFNRQKISTFPGISLETRPKREEMATIRARSGSDNGKRAHIQRKNLGQEIKPKTTIRPIRYYKHMEIQSKSV